eukprot:m.182108 g.182108  ORF g.182108 m.182108 type:complete len:69 (-) comp10481_c1_seq2:187-393(-)
MLTLYIASLQVTAKESGVFIVLAVDVSPVGQSAAPLCSPGHCMRQSEEASVHSSPCSGCRLHGQSAAQ